MDPAGRLAGPFAAELLSGWLNARDSRKGRRCLVDLNDVTFIDKDGETALCRMMREGAQLVARGVYTRQLVQDLKSSNQRRLCRFLGRFFALTLSAAVLRCLFWAALIYLDTSPLHAQGGVAIAPQSSYLGSVPDGQATERTIRDLAGETLTQARDRFKAGVTDNLEVVQAQESVASADQAYISSLYTFNIAKIELARAAGVAERAVLAYLGGK